MYVDVLDGDKNQKLTGFYSGFWEFNEEKESFVPLRDLEIENTGEPFVAEYLRIYSSKNFPSIDLTHPIRASFIDIGRTVHIVDLEVIVNDMGTSYTSAVQKILNGNITVSEN